jgi:MFS family permease
MKNSRYAWWVVIVLTIAYIFSFIDRVILSLLVEPIKRDLHLTDVQLSYLMGLSFALFYTVLGIPFGMLADRANRKWIVTFGIFTWSVLTAGCGLVRNFWQFFFMRAGVGVGEATLSPSAYSMIADYFPKDKLSRALSVYGTGIYIGSGLSMIAGSSILLLVGDKPTVEIPWFGSIFSWQLVFFYVGLPGILVAIIMATIREPQRQGANLKPVSLGETVAYLIPNAPTFLGVCFGLGFYTMVTYSAASWVPSFLMRTYKMDNVTVGFYYGLSTIVMAGSGIVAGGWLADYWQKKGIVNAKTRVAMLGAVCFMTFNLIFPLMPTPELAFLFIFPANFFASFPFGATPAAIQSIMPNQMRASSSAIGLLIINMMGMILGPTLVAVYTEHLFKDALMLRYSLMLNAGTSLVCSFVFFYIAHRNYAKSLAYLEKWEKR